MPKSGPATRTEPAAYARVVEDERLVLAPGGEQAVLEAGAGHPLEVLGRDDLVGVDVAAAQRDADAGVGRERSIGSPVSGRVGARSRGRRGWTGCRARAVAAATSGLTRWVRPPLPCRPSKLRLDVEALRSPGASWSGFMPRHIEQPAQAPLGAGLGEDLVQALRLGLQAHPRRAGHDEHAHAVGDLVALDDRGGGAQVLDPAVGAGADEDGVDRDVAQRRARPPGPCTPGRPRRPSRSLLVGDTTRGRARDADSGSALAGVGAPGDERASARRRRGRPRRRRRRRRRCAACVQSATAASQSAPVGACGRPRR